MRWLGVAYLVYLAFRAWRAPASDLTLVRPPSARRTVLRGFLVSLANPKTLAFYAAFLPQFIDRGGDVGLQMLWLGATFVAIAVVVDSGWALMAARLSGWLTIGARLRNRVTGVALVGAGLGQLGGRVRNRVTAVALVGAGLGLALARRG